MNAETNIHVRRSKNTLDCLLLVKSPAFCNPPLADRSCERGEVTIKTAHIHIRIGFNRSPPCSSGGSFLENDCKRSISSASYRKDVDVCKIWPAGFARWRGQWLQLRSMALPKSQCLEEKPMAILAGAYVDGRLHSGIWCVRKTHRENSNHNISIDNKSFQPQIRVVASLICPLSNLIF